MAEKEFLKINLFKVYSNNEEFKFEYIYIVLAVCKIRTTTLLFKLIAITLSNDLLHIWPIFWVNSLVKLLIQINKPKMWVENMIIGDLSNGK